MLDIFVNMNLEMQKTGNLSASIGKDELLKLVRCLVINSFGYVRPVPVTSYVPCRWLGHSRFGVVPVTATSQVHQNHQAICNFMKDSKRSLSPSTKA